VFTCPSLAVDLEDGSGLPLADEEVTQHGIPRLRLRQLQGLIGPVQVMRPANHSFLQAKPQSTYIGRDETGSVYLPTQLERKLQLYW
jgi:hypothetical protein